jgi:MFS family permease
MAAPRAAAVRPSSPAWPVPRARHTAALAVSVGLVLADSSLVVLALPAVMDTFRASVAGAAWVLISFNVVMALAAVPAALIAMRAGPRRMMVVGLLLFAAASAGCAAAGSIGVLVAARCAQAAGAAFAATAALELLRCATGDDRRAARLWIAAGTAGAALGPALGGLVTQELSWRAVFGLQVPVAACLLLMVARAPAPVRDVAATDRPRPLENASLALLSAALTAALFLLVLMLVQAWGQSPLAAAATVSVMPVAAITAGRLVRGSASRLTAVAGAVLVAGGLVALGELPRGVVAWTLLPQALVGVGIALALPALTQAALRDRRPQALHAGWTLAARHAGVVAGLLVLTPLFTADLNAQARAARASGSAIVLEANLPFPAKIALGDALVRRAAGAPDRVPDLAPAFRAQHPAPGTRPEYRRVEAALGDQMRRAGTAAFSRAFLIAGVMAIAAAALAAAGARRGAAA